MMRVKALVTVFVNREKKMPGTVFPLAEDLAARWLDKGYVEKADEGTEGNGADPSFFLEKKKEAKKNRQGKA